MYINNETLKSYNFVAPANDTDAAINEIPFPVATAAIVEGQTVRHVGNPTTLRIDPTAALTYTVEIGPGVQPGTCLIVENTGTAAATVGGVPCANRKTTTLLYDGNGFIALGTTAKP